MQPGRTKTDLLFTISHAGARLLKLSAGKFGISTVSLGRLLSFQLDKMEFPEVSINWTPSPNAYLLHIQPASPHRFEPEPSKCRGRARNFVSSPPKQR